MIVARLRESMRVFSGNPDHEGGLWCSVRSNAISVISAFLIPAAIGAILVVGLFVWEYPKAVSGQKAVDFGIVEDANSALSPRRALDLLAVAPSVSGWSTKLSESPWWFNFTVVPSLTNDVVEIELPSRHAKELTCWDSSTLRSLGFASRNGFTGSIRPLKAGFAIRFGNPQSNLRVLCRATFVGPAFLSLEEWTESRLEHSMRDFSYDAGMLDGGLAAMVYISIVLAIARRNTIYVALAATLFVTLRLGAVTAGMDFQFLGHPVPASWALSSRAMVTAASYALFFALYALIYRNALTKRWERNLMSAANWLSVPLLLGAPLLPYHMYLPLLWAATAFGIVSMVSVCARLLVLRGSFVEIWFSGAIGVSVVNYFYDIVVSAAGLREQFGVLSAAPVTLLSGGMLILGVVEHVRREQRRLNLTRGVIFVLHEVVPTALLTLNRNGELLRCNPAAREILGVNPHETRRHWDDYFEQGAWQRLQDALRENGKTRIELRCLPVPEVESAVLTVDASALADKVYATVRRIAPLAED